MIEHIEQGTLPAHVKACIALTSWKKRINTVGLTIYNLFETCGPDYHIVLTLAEEEFPKKEQELPRDLLLMNRAGMFEILWCKRNVKSFKKWLPCSQKYSTVPVISADDDCIYVCNYANELYNMWSLNKHSIISFRKGNYMNHVTGPATLYAPKWFKCNCQLRQPTTDELYKFIMKATKEEHQLRGDWDSNHEEIGADSERFIQEIQTGEVQSLTDGRGLVAYGLDNGKMFIYDLYVLPEYRNAGVGGTLLDKVIEVAGGRPVVLTVNSMNARQSNCTEITDSGKWVQYRITAWSCYGWKGNRFLKSMRMWNNVLPGRQVENEIVWK